MPIGDVLVGDPAGDVEHDDAALALDVVDVTQASKLFLAGGVPDVEDDRAAVGVEEQGTDLDTDGGYVKGGLVDVHKITPLIPIYFFSNSPDKWRFTKVVFPVPPSPTRTS